MGFEFAATICKRTGVPEVRFGRPNATAIYLFDLGLLCPVLFSWRELYDSCVDFFMWAES